VQETHTIPPIESPKFHGIILLLSGKFGKKRIGTAAILIQRSVTVFGSEFRQDDLPNGRSDFLFRGLKSDRRAWRFLKVAFSCS
jgi:hypothetical protein